jgi:hypothetical protein
MVLVVDDQGLNAYAAGALPRPKVASYTPRTHTRSRLDSLCAACLFTALLLPVGVSAQDVRVSHVDCGAPVRLVARQVPLSIVLKRLAESLGFELVYQSQSDPLVTTDERLAATDLVRQLAHDMNFSIEQAFDPSCLQNRRVAKLSVLPGTSEKSHSVTAARPPWQTPEMERVARQTTADYLRSHGLEDQSIEDLAVR